MRHRTPLSVEIDYVTEAINLYLGESLVHSWCFEKGDDVTKAQWRVDKFVAQRLGDLFRHYEQESEDR